MDNVKVWLLCDSDDSDSSDDFNVEDLLSHYRQKFPWIGNGKQQAFHNWMERDILFAKQIKAECEENAVPCIVNDGLKRHRFYSNIQTPILIFHHR